MLYDTRVKLLKILVVLILTKFVSACYQIAVFVCLSGDLCYLSENCSTARFLLLNYVRNNRLLNKL